MSKKKVKNKLVIWGEYLPFHLVYALMRALPLRPAYRLSDWLFALIYRLDVRHRRRSIAHLQHAGVAATPREAAQLARRSYRSFAMLLVEVCKFDQCYQVKNLRYGGHPETLRRLLDPEHPQSAIIVTAHYGNWEVAGTGWADLSGIPTVSIMRQFNNPLIGNLVLAHRRGPKHELVDKNGGIREIMKALRSGKNVAILADQHAGRHEGVETRFFGQPARAHTSPALLHLKTGVPLVVEVTRRVGEFQFEFLFSEMKYHTPTADKDADIQALCQWYTSELERLIRECPDQWLWAHRRWLNIHRSGAPTPPASLGRAS